MKPRTLLDAWIDILDDLDWTCDFLVPYRLVPHLVSDSPKCDNELTEDGRPPKGERQGKIENITMCYDTNTESHYLQHSRCRDDGERSNLNRQRGTPNIPAEPETPANAGRIEAIWNAWLLVFRCWWRGAGSAYTLFLNNTVRACRGLFLSNESGRTPA